MNLLMTLDRNYVPQLNVMLFSALHSDSAAHFDVYLLHDEGLSEEDVAGTRVLLGQRGELHLIRVNEDGLADAPTSDRYPKTIYYRIFAAKYLPDTLDRVLYLDPDIVVRQSLRELYEMPMGTAFFAAATHIRGFLHRFNELRLDMDEDSPYINSGVMLMNLQALRAEQNTQAVFDYMDAHKGRADPPGRDRGGHGRLPRGSAGPAVLRQHLCGGKSGLSPHGAGAAQQRRAHGVRACGRGRHDAGGRAAAVRGHPLLWAEQALEAWIYGGIERVL